MQILKGHRHDKPVRSLAFAPSGDRLASSARDYKTFLWDLGTGEHQVIDDHDSYTVAFSPDGRLIATGRSKDLSLWDAQTGTLRTCIAPTDYGMGIEVAFSPDGRVLARAGRTVRLWDPVTLVMLPGPQPEEAARHATKCLAFSRDGRTLATGHEGGNSAGGMTRHVRLWDTATWRSRDFLVGPTATVDALAWSPDGRFLAAAAGRTLWVWDVAARAAVVKHLISEQHYKDVAFSPDGRFLAFARNDATVRLWETAGWTEVAAYDWKVGPMISVAFAPDSMRAAGGSGKGKIVVWDVDL
jgi:WD40 repeat protein